MSVAYITDCATLRQHSFIFYIIQNYFVTKQITNQTKSWIILSCKDKRCAQMGTYSAFAIMFSLKQPTDQSQTTHNAVGIARRLEDDPWLKLR